MYKDVVIEQPQVIGKIKYLPAVSIILPFHPITTGKSELEGRLMHIMQNVESELLTGYIAEKAVPVLIKLKNLIRNINYRTHKKSIAIFVSPVVDKIYYLDIEVQQKIVIDDSFEMRNIVLSKKKEVKYLVLFIGNEISKLYIGNCSEFRLIKKNFAGGSSTTDFMEFIDHGLTLVLKAYPLPVFLIASAEATEHFKNISENKADIIQHIEFDKEIKEVSELEGRLAIFEEKWKYIRQAYLLKQLEKAREKNKLAFGLSGVWNTAMRNKGKLLLIETRYITPRMRLKSGLFIRKDYLIGNPFYRKDEVDEIIENVLINGGDVEFIDTGVLNDYKHIALIER